jgi:hypothetical protein
MPKKKNVLKNQKLGRENSGGEIASTMQYPKFPTPPRPHRATLNCIVRKIQTLARDRLTLSLL